MEQLEDACKQGEQLMIPQEDVSQEMLQILAANRYYKIVSATAEETETLIYFAQIRAPEDMQSLRAACESGKDCFLPSHLDTTEATEIMKNFNYAIATESRAEPLFGAADKEDHISSSCYYIQIFSQQFSLTPAPRVGAAFRDKVEYKQFIERTQKLLEVQGLKQTAVFQLVFEVAGIEGKKTPSIGVQITALNMGVVEKDFCKGKHGEFGFYPDYIKIAIRPAWEGAAVGIERVPDESLGNKSMSVESSTRRTDQFHIGVGFNKMGVQYGRGRRELDELKCTSVLSCFDELGGACYEWKIVRLKSGKSYNFEKPFKSVMNLFTTKSWSDLPLNGSGVKVPVSEINRIEWPLPPASSQELYLDVYAETRMVFLKKDGLIIKPMIVNIPYATKLKLEEQL